MPGRRRDIPSGNTTMHLDAVADDLEEVDAPNLGPVTAPPPLPPEKAPARVWVIGGVVVLLAAALGLGLGVFLLGRGAEPPVDAPAEPAQPAAVAPPEPAVEPAPNVVPMEEFHFDGDETLGEAEDEELPAE